MEREEYMQSHPLVSVITPTYNHEKFIAQCIESVLDQTYTHWEQIIIDDGSSDNTKEIVAGYKDKRIKYIRQDNVGIWKLGETYNKALSVSQGELIAILEGDDYWPVNKLEKQIPAFSLEDVVLSWGRCAWVNNEGKTLRVDPTNPIWFRNAKREDIIRRLLFEGFIAACTVICRKSALISIGGFRQAEYTPYVDYPTWLELSLLGNFSFVDEVLGYWRFHKQQVSSTKTISMAEGHKYSIDFFKTLPQELVDLLGVSIDELIAAYQRRMIWAKLRAARIALANNEWKEAKKISKELLSSTAPNSMKLRALLCLVCAYCGVDFEPLAAMLGRPIWK